MVDVLIAQHLLGGDRVRAVGEGRRGAGDDHDRARRGHRLADQRSVGVDRDLGALEYAVDAEPQRLAGAVVEIRDAVARARAGVAAGQQRDGGGRAGVDEHGHGLGVPRGAVGRADADENAVDARRGRGGRHGRRPVARRHGDRQVVAFGIDGAGEVHRVAFDVGRRDGEAHRRAARGVHAVDRPEDTGLSLIVSATMVTWNVRCGRAAVAVADGDRHVRRAGGSRGRREHQDAVFLVDEDVDRLHHDVDQRLGRAVGRDVLDRLRERRRPRPGSRRPSG